MNTNPVSIPVADAHQDVLTAIEKQNRSFHEPSSTGQVNLPRLLAGNVRLACFAAFIAPAYRNCGPARVLQLIDLFYQVLDQNKGKLKQVKDRQSLQGVLSGEQLGVLLTVEGGEALGGDLAVLRMMYQLGVRMLTLTWNGRNEIADGTAERGTGGGLTSFGREAVAEMNRLGMAVDISHLSERGFWDVMEISGQGPLASHANCASLCSHPRNLTDGQIKALAQKGGIICLTFVPAFVDSEKPSLERVIDHVEHAAALAGVSRVGLGSDFDGIENVIPGLEDPSFFPALAGGMLRRGFKEEDVRGIMGENLVNYLSRVLG